MKKAFFALVAVMLIAPPPAMAADAYMNGTLGWSPGYSTMTGPAGEKCKTGWGGSCKKISYNNLTANSAEKALTKWIAANGKSGNTIWLYSLSTHGAIQYLNKNPDDQNTWIMVGSPSKPDNSEKGWNFTPLENPAANVTFVTKQGDSVAQSTAPKRSYLTHMFGYRRLDAREPATSYTVEGTNTKDNVYGEVPIPTESRKALLAAETSKAPQSTKDRSERTSERKSDRKERRESRRPARSDR